MPVTAKFVHTDYVFTCINTMPISTMWFYANKKYYNYTNILIFNTWRILISTKISSGWTAALHYDFKNKKCLVFSRF